MTQFTTTLAKLATTFACASAIVLGGCAVDSSEAAPTDAANPNAELAPAVETPVLMVVVGGPVTVAARAVDLPERASELSDAGLEQLRRNLDMDTPLEEMRAAAANDELILVPLTDAPLDPNFDIDSCRYQTPISNTARDAYCMGDAVTPGVVLEVAESELRGYDAAAATGDFSRASGPVPSELTPASTDGLGHDVWKPGLDAPDIDPAPEAPELPPLPSPAPVAR